MKRKEAQRRASSRKRDRLLVATGALMFSLLIPAIGYVYLGPLVAFLFLLGYLGGFFLWLVVPVRVGWPYVRNPYWAALVIFILHKVEENQMEFFRVLGDRITGIATPELTPLLVLGLLVLPLGTWLSIPFLIKRRSTLGYFLAWTFFTSLGIVELAHFVFPVLTNEPYGYFPGMVSATILAPIGIWGMWRLSGMSPKNVLAKP